MRALSLVTTIVLFNTPKLCLKRIAVTSTKQILAFTFGGNASRLLCQLGFGDVCQNQDR
jgi:hypothetical protein